MNSKSQGSSRDVYAVYVAGANVVAHDGVAGAVIWIFTNPARAEDVTVADFEQITFQFVRHGDLL
jgi:hypothetical protein